MKTAFVVNICEWLSALFFLVALFGTVFFGIGNLVRRQRAGQSAIDEPTSSCMLKKDYLKLFYWLFITTLLIYAVGVWAQMSASSEKLTVWEYFYNAFQRTDAKNYIEIAQNGYTAVGETRYFIVFFPLFPYMVRVFSVFFGGNCVLAAFILNFILMYAAIVVIFRLGIMDFRRETVYASIGLLLLFPEAFFLHCPYNEPLFLLLSALSLFYTRRDNYAMAGIMGFFCALTRAAGVLCAVPLVARSFIRAWQAGKFFPLQWLKKAAWSLVTLCGTGAYLLLNYFVTGNAFMFLIHQSEHWFNKFELFPHAVGTIADRLLTNTEMYQAPLWISQFIAIFVFLILLILGVRRLSTEMSLYNCGYFLMMISLSWLLSGPRYLMVMFPAYFVLADMLKNKCSRMVVYGLFAIGLCVMTALFATGYCIY